MDHETPTTPTFPHSLNVSNIEYKLLRLLRMATFGASTFGEWYSVVRKMQENPRNTWPELWASLARNVEAAGEESALRERFTSAGDCFLRAAMYHHLAEYYALISSGDFSAHGNRCGAAFTKALPLMPWHGEAVNIEANNESYPCYVMMPEEGVPVHGVILFVAGLESCAEEEYFYLGFSALRRGYGVLLFQGPGQTGMLRNDPTNFVRPDMELPLQVALDYIASRPEFAGAVTVAVGSGFGAYYVSRLAAVDHRVQVLVASPPTVSLQPLLIEVLGTKATAVDVEESALMDIPDSVMPSRLKVLLQNMFHRFGVGRLQQMIQISAQYSLQDRLYRIHCPTLAVTGVSTFPEQEAQAQEFIEGVRSTIKERLVLNQYYVPDLQDTEPGLASMHREKFDWIDEIVDRLRS